MPIETVKAESAEIKKNIRIVKKMTGGMGFDENMGKVNWRIVRLISGFGYKFMPKVKGVRFEKHRSDRSGYEVAVPPQVTGGNIITYIHGGGFVSGSAASSRGYTSMLAAGSGCRVVAADYALAPEKPFPHGFNDCCEVLDEVTREYPGARVALVGESAGANLCAALALWARNEGRGELISSVTLHSPFLDFTGKLDRSAYPTEDFTVKPGCLPVLKEIYAAGSDPADPYISPYYGDYSGFPPTFITCDSRETLYADALWLYEKLESVGTEVMMIRGEGMFHAFAATGTQAPETKRILTENIGSIKNHF